jgi:hypothetical protein
MVIPPSGRQRSVVRLLIDVDTGTDDAGALVPAATHPALSLVAFTAVDGDRYRFGIRLWLAGDG